MSTDLSTNSLPISGTMTVGATSYEDVTLSSVIPEFFVYVDDTTNTTALLSYTGGADAGVKIPSQAWVRIWRRPEGYALPQVLYLKCLSAGISVYYSDSVQPCAPADIDINVDLDPATDGVQVYGTTGSGVTAILVDATGAQVVVGAAADGAAKTGAPVLVGGQDGTNAQSLKVDTTGRPECVGAAADGATPSGAPVLVAGQDGTNVETLKTDVTGRLEVIGGAADGAAAAGNPVPVAGVDGAGNVETVLTDTTGCPMVVGPGAAAAAVVGNPVRVGASDGTNTRDVLADAAGRLLVSGAAADGAALTGNPVPVAGVDGVGNVQALLVDTTGRALVAQPTAADLNCTEASAADIKTAVQLIDDGIATVDAAVVAKGFQATGSDGTLARILKTDAAGELQIDVLSSALPSGAATEATLADIKTAAQLLDDAVYTDGSGTPSKGLAVMGTDGTNPQIVAVDTTGRQLVVGGAADGAALAGNPVPVAGVDGSGNAQIPLVEADGHVQVDVLASALPSGAATLAEQQTQTTSLQLLDDAVSTTGAAVPAKGFQATGTDGTNARALKTDTDGHPQVDVLSSALPSGAATSAAQTDGTQVVKAYGIDGVAAQHQVLTDTTGAQIVVGAGADGAAKTGNPVLVAGEDGTNAQTLKTDTDGHPQVDVLTSALPSGAATLAEQQTQTTALQLLDDTVYTDGAGTPSKGVLVLGSDATNPQAIAVDSTGRQVAVGAAAVGAAVAGAPVLVGAEDATGNARNAEIDVGATYNGILFRLTDGTNLSSLSASGDLEVCGNAGVALATETTVAAIETAVEIIDDVVATVAGAIGTKGVSLIGSDGANWRLVKVDADGHVQADILSCALPSGAATEATVATLATEATVSALAGPIGATGSAVPTDAYFVGGTDGTNLRALKTDADGHVQIDVLSDPALSDATDSVATYAAVKRFTGTLTNDNGTTEQELTGLGASTFWKLTAVYFKRTAGSAANYQIRIAEATGWTLDDIVSQRYASASTAVATQLSDHPDSGLGRIFQADANGKLYWESGFDGGADNNAAFVFEFVKMRAA